MERTLRDDTEMMKYLLGDLQSDKRTQFEELYLMDGEFFEQLLDVEDDLIHSYVMNELAEHERELFERHFLSIPQNREKVKHAQTLRAYLIQAQTQVEPLGIRFREKIASGLRTVATFFTPRTTGWKLAYALAMAVMIFFTTSLLLKTNDFDIQIMQFKNERQLFLQKEQQSRQQIEAEGRKRDELAAQLQQEQSRRAVLEKEISQQRLTKGVPFTITLGPGISRSTQSVSQLNLAQIKQRAPWIEIQLILEDPQVYESYRVFLVNAAEDTVLIKYGLQAQTVAEGKALVLQLATSDLTDDEYQITVKGVTASREIEHVDSYQLTVKKE